MAEYAYVWAWGPRFPRVLDRKGQACRVIVRGGMNSCLVEFRDGYRAVVSRNGLRRSANHASVARSKEGGHE